MKSVAVVALIFIALYIILFSSSCYNSRSVNNANNCVIESDNDMPYYKCYYVKDGKVKSYKKPID